MAINEAQGWHMCQYIVCMDAIARKPISTVRRGMKKVRKERTSGMRGQFPEVTVFGGTQEEIALDGGDRKDTLERQDSRTLWRCLCRAWFRMDKSKRRSGANFDVAPDYHRPMVRCWRYDRDELGKASKDHDSAELVLTPKQCQDKTRVCRVPEPLPSCLQLRQTQSGTRRRKV